MECTMNNMDLNLDNGLNMKLSADTSNSMEDSDDSSSSANFNLTLDDSEADEFDSTRNYHCQNDFSKNSSAVLQDEMNRINNVKNGFDVQKKTFLTSEPWFPSMSLLELAYKLKQAEFRVFGSSNGISNNTEALSEASLKNSVFCNTSELGELNRNYSSMKFNYHQSNEGSGPSPLPDMKIDSYKTSSYKLSSSGNTNGVKQVKPFVSLESAYSLNFTPKSSSPRVTITEVGNVNQETLTCYPSVVKDEQSLDTNNLTSMPLNYSELRSRYSASFFDEKRRYPCSYCPYRSDTRSHLKRHELAIHQNGAKARNRLPRMPEYIATMTTASLSAASVFGESDHRRHHCDQCMYQTNSACHLRRHQSTMHGNEKPFRCNICLLEFSRSEKVNQHFAIFHPGITFNIKAMRKVATPEKRSIQVRKLVPVGTVIKRDDVGSTGVIDKEESAEVVDTDLVQLVEAAVAARREGHKPFGCQQCLYTSRDVWHLRRHIADVHLKRRNYRCKVCRYATGRQDRLFTHMRSHGEMFCLYCDYSTAQVGAYRAHMQSCSAAGSREVSTWNESGDASNMICSEQEQTCRLCNVAFSFRADLETHINAVHVETLLGSHLNMGAQTDPVNCASIMDVDRYVCRACGHVDVAGDLQSIQEHVMSHAPESYECTVDDCDFRATYARTLELHRKYYHNTDASINASPRAGSPSLKSAAASGDISASSTPVKLFSASDLQTPMFSSVTTAVISTVTPSIGQFVCPVCKDRAPFKYRRSFEKHIGQHSVNVRICPMCVESFLSIDEMQAHLRSVHGANI